MLGVRSLSLPFSADHRSHFVCFFAAPILQYSNTQHSNTPTLPAPRSVLPARIRRSVFGVGRLGVGRLFLCFQRHHSSISLLRPRFAALLFHDKIAMLARPFPPCRIFKPII